MHGDEHNVFEFTAGPGGGLGRAGIGVAEMSTGATAVPTIKTASLATKVKIGSKGVASQRLAFNPH